MAETGIHFIYIQQATFTDRKHRSLKAAPLSRMHFGHGALIYVRSRLQGVNEALAPASDACMSLRARCSHILAYTHSSAIPHDIISSFDAKQGDHRITYRRCAAAST